MKKNCFQTLGYYQMTKKNKVNNDRVENFSLVKTAFDNDMKNARIYLKGELVQQNIVVEGRAEVILNELFQQILQKSEKKSSN